MDARYSTEIERLYLQMYHLLFEYARSCLPNDSLAEEAVQETFYIACQKPESVCTSPKPEGWLVNTLKFVISNMRRSRLTADRILREYLALQISKIKEYDDGMAIEILYEDIVHLDEFRLLKEMAVEGKTHLEMAQSRGISVEACRKRVQRAKETLRKKLEIDVTE